MNNSEQKPKKKRSGCLIAVLVVAIIGVVAAAGGGRDSESTDQEQSQSGDVQIESPVSAETDVNITETDDSSVPDEISEDEGGIKYKEGQYKIGADMPAGAYVLIQDYFDWPSYFAITTDANGKDILKNDNFDGHSIVEVVDGEFLEISRCYAVPLEESAGFAAVDGYLSDGAYIVGKHIPAGEYKVESTEDFAAYICIYPDLRRSKISSNDNFDGSRYVSLEDGQLFEIKRGRIFVGE